MSEGDSDDSMVTYVNAEGAIGLLQNTFNAIRFPPDTCTDS